MEIGDIKSVPVFCVYPCLCSFNLLVKALAGTLGKVAGALPGAKYTAANAHSAVPVGAGEATVKGELINLFAKTLTHFVVKTAV